jgi:hypothetical protein
MRLLLLVLLGSCIHCAWAQQTGATEATIESTKKPSQTEVQVQPAAEPVSAQAGLRVYVDPATGRRLSNPTAEQRANAAALDRDNPAFSTSSEGLREEPLPGGGVLVHLDGRFQSAVTVQRQADGSLVQTCNNPIHDKLGAGHTHAAPVAVERADR